VSLPPSPDAALDCLLLQPRFSETNFWNVRACAESVGARATSPPLGLLTVAALLPQAWRVRLVDLNVRDVTEAEWSAADVVCTGGMLPQQAGILATIARARRDGKYVVVGGPDPTSQPELYAGADAVVVGEGEAAIPLWLDAWRAGRPRGVFAAPARPDVATSPVPRFELVDFADYLYVGVQLSRGCPFDCEFCDIIELYGRRPRTKPGDRFLAELDRLHELGYRGWIEVVDDNFIGDKLRVKALLGDLVEWQQRRGHPFFFGTEATLNVADDDELLALLRDAGFRQLFVGIETPDPELLKVAQKRVNAMRPVADRVRRIHDHGISVAAGFILGFDGERAGQDQALIACIEECAIAISMVGLLVALPNTQLTRRLQREGRLLGSDLRVAEPGQGDYRLVVAGGHSEGEDQSSGLNFVTSRDRVEVYREYQRVLATVYAPRVYMDRVLRAARALRARYRHAPGAWGWKRNLRGLWRTTWWMTRRPGLRWLYWRNVFATLVLGLDRFEAAQRLMSFYMHVHPVAQRVVARLDVDVDYALHHAAYPRSTARP
jgi:radical SAM superfamily enzyme YgiQ (UPF0313 family)